MKIYHAILFALLLFFTGCQPGDRPDPNASGEKRFTSFSFNAIDNPSLNSDVVGTITNDSIKLEVPAGVSRNGLIPTFVFRGSLITPANRIAQNFNNPVVYTIRAENGTSKDYTVVCSHRVGDTLQMIRAHWQIYKDSVASVNNFYILVNGTPHYPTAGVYWGTPADYFSFNSIGMLTIFENNNGGTSPYQVYPNGRLFIDALSMYDTARILTLDAANATLYWTGSSPNGGQYARKVYLRR